MADGSDAGSKTDSARKLAEDCLATAGGNEQIAERKLLQLIMADAPLVAEFLKPICHNLIRGARRDVRRYISGSRSTSAGLHLLAQSWYDWPLSSGVMLGEADSAALLSEKQMYGRLVKQNSMREDFFTRIHSKMKHGKKVRESMTNDEIGALAKRCGLSRENA